MRTTPSFAGLSATSELASRVMRSNTARGTAHEKMLCRQLRRMGIAFRRNVATLPGKPDVLFVSRRLAVFCDGDFWHGRDWRILRARLERRGNPKYWVAKIQSNIDRDVRITRALEHDGWTVIRVWESEIVRDAEGVAKRIVTAMSALPLRRTRKAFEPAAPSRSRDGRGGLPQGADTRRTHRRRARGAG